MALIGFPYLAVPAFAVFGRKRFHGYVLRRQELDAAALKELKEMEASLKEVAPPEGLRELALVVHKARQIGFTAGNKVQLLIDGEETYGAMLAAIRSAKRYILIQSYIFRNDDTGILFRDALVEKAQQGVRVFCLYDRIGTSFSKKFTKSFEEAGIEIAGFEGTRSFLQHFQINFRNHRKLLVIDGEVALLGGHNIGDDYLGKWKKYGPWRDTHVRIEGPAAAVSQLSFVKDWYWARNYVPNLDWDTRPLPDGCPGLVFHTGPADHFEACNLFYIALINSAQERLWLATPYFVPPDGLASALSLAALRGVDVRIILPTITDNRTAKLASKVHVAKLQQVGVKFWRYDAGFLHQKVLLCDRLAGVVGSANMDARSFFINFELQQVSDDSGFLDSLETMFEKDFQRSTAVHVGYFDRLPWYRQLASRASTLAGPML